MKTCIHLILIVATTLPFLPSCHFTDSHRDMAAVQAEIGALDSRIDNWYIQKKADSLTGLYATGFVYLPEYKPPISGADDLHHFFTDWFSRTDIRSYKKTIYKIDAVADHLLEIGNFVLDYSKKDSAGAHTYSGKYMVMWKREADGKLAILSEAFGSGSYIEPEAMPYAAVVVKERPDFRINQLSKGLEPELLAFDSGVVKAVLTGDGEARAREFTNDGIYLPHFDRMQVGMTMLRPYMVKTYSGGSLTYVRDTYHEIFNLGDFVFLAGHFEVGWDNAKNSGSFAGDMSNLMKRGTDGKLLMYCQLAHNDAKGVVVNK